ncbi:hypothetical protein IAU60_001258 [Kwoniella sp. DSM 27419]
MELDTTDIDAQIAALQAARAAKVAKAEQAQRARDKEEAEVLVGSTPTKAVSRAAAQELPKPVRPAQPNFNVASSSRVRPTPQALPSLSTPKSSSMGANLAALRRTNSSSQSSQAVIPRSTSFADRVKPVKSLPKPSQGRTATPEAELSDKGKGKEIMRDEESLTIIENLELGPKDFGLDPEGGEEWRDVEPTSGIRLCKRLLPHPHVQDHLSGRYYLSPSQLYSVIRLSRDGATYDVPVEGDWITIAVVAQRGEVRVSGTKTSRADSEDEDDEVEEDEEVKEHTKQSLAEASKVQTTPKDGQSKLTRKTKGKSKGSDRQRVPRKYINFTLCSLPPRNRSSGKTETSGDALLHLLLFEADAIVSEPAGEDGEPRKSYRGGSGGAYEKWCNLTEGSVVAILNPRVWRNVRAGPNGPHPLAFPLGLNPSFADSIILLGQAKDLGRCSALQKDGNRCKTWVDLRQNGVCDYHVHAAIARSKSSRAEFTAGTASFALSTRPASGGVKGKPGFDPKRKTGLLPAGGAQPAPRGVDNGGGGATYVIGGGVINTGAASRGGLKGFGNEFLSEKLGRDRSDKRKRQMEEKEAEAVLAKLLARDGGLNGGGSTGGRYLATLERDKDKGDRAKGSAGSKEGPEGQPDRKRPFSAAAIKRIGYDPTARAARADGEDAQRRLDAFNAIKGEESGCRLERLAKRLDEEKKAVQRMKQVADAKAAAAAATTSPDPDEEEDMVDLD